MKHSVLIFILFFSISASLACDICGCGVGSYYIGILPEFNKKILGLRYRHNSLRTHIGAGGASTYLTTNETYRTAELWGGWTIGKKFRLMASIPVSYNEKVNQGSTFTKTGLGDVSVQGFYQLFDKRNTIGSKLLVQSLWLGAGIKAPTGKYERNAKALPGEDANIFQLGSGSTDFTINGMYDVRLMDAGINAAASYKINTANGESYRYGNKLSLNLQAYYKIRVLQKFTIAPGVGVMFENARLDSDAGYSVDVSGGNITLGSVGFETTLKNFAFGANWQMPLQQDLANGFVKANNRGMVHLAVMF